jgi:hypothetical protein
MMKTGISIWVNRIGCIALSIPCLFTVTDLSAADIKDIEKVSADLVIPEVTDKRICDEYGGDRSNVFIAGFSRGSIACNFIGLYDDEIASLWRGFICHAYYDGIGPMKWPGTQGAIERLKRLRDRPQFISHELPSKKKVVELERTKAYLAKEMPQGHFTFQQMSFPDHTDCWVLRDIPERKAVRDWFKKVASKEEQ